MKRILACLLAMALCLPLLAGCGKEEENAADPSAIWSETRYTADRVPLDTYNLPAAAIQGDTVYFASYATANSGAAFLCSAECATGKISELTGYRQYMIPPLTPEQEAGTEKVVRYSYPFKQICPADENIWILVERSPDSVGSNQARAEDTLLLLRADPADGAVIQEIALAEGAHDSSHISLCCDGQGNAYIYYEKGVSIYSPAGEAHVR